MDPEFKLLVEKILEDSKYFAAVAAVFGVIIGSILTVIGNVVLHYLKELPAKQVEKAQKKILVEMLEDGRFVDKWRSIETLSSVIGESEEKTKSLLIQVKARGSENKKNVWGLIKYHPFNQIKI